VSDVIDSANELAQRHLDAALAARPRPVMLRHMTDECVDCGDEIPPARRAAIPDAAYCVPCQEKHDRAERRR
jgi:phage/conjugal plasmid C-4 type zinc finger TraR family protein